MKIHYISGIAALFVVAVHIIMRLVMPFSMSLEYENVIANYQNIAYAVLLESILVLIAIHGFNGLRIILLEFRQNFSLGKRSDYFYASRNDCNYCIWHKNNNNG